MTDKRWRLPMHRFQVAAMAATPPPGYLQMNEAQRDSLYLSRTIEFIAHNPRIATAMALVKIEVFLDVFGIYGVVLAALAILGAILHWRDPRSWPLTLAVLSYSVPFVLVIAYYSRYRAPIGPLLCVLAAAGLWTVSRRLGSARLLWLHSRRV